jgi:hypothetical protein
MTTSGTSAGQQHDACRLCGNTTRRLFEHRVLNRLTVGYHECDGCGSLQTDEPTWLDEAYGPTALNLNAFFAAQRARFMQARLTVLARVFKLPAHARMLDIGGQTGLLCRMLRDVGFQAYSFDPYAPNYFAPDYAATPEQSFDLVSAIEVWEHFAHPAVETHSCFAGRPALVVIGTTLWQRQGRDWAYLTPPTGQHVFLYSTAAMQWIARREGYEVWTSDGCTVFARDPMTRAQRVLLGSERWLTKATECAIPLLSPVLNRRIQAELDARLAQARPGETQHPGT